MEGEYLDQYVHLCRLIGVFVNKSYVLFTDDVNGQHRSLSQADWNLRSPHTVFTISVRIDRHETRRSRVRPPPRSATFFRRD